MTIIGVEAVELVLARILEIVKERDALLIVTADHMIEISESSRLQA